MKKISIILLLVVVLGAYLFINFSSCEKNGTEIATFNFNNNLQTDYGKEIPILFTVPEGLKRVELIYNDSTFQTWENPKAGEIKLAMRTDFYGVGSYPIKLVSTDQEGLVQEDSYLIRVVSDIKPKQKKVQIVSSYPHNDKNYTQGFEFDGNRLYEGTGDPGQQGNTKVGEISLTNGQFIGAKNGLDGSKFGEGITILGDKLYQLTWQNQQCFVYDKNTMTLTGEFQYVGQGWGLTNNGTQLIMSNGSEYITFRDPKTFAVKRTIQVYNDAGPVANLNELEYIDGKIYANVYQTSMVVVIEPNTGRVLEQWDASALVEAGRGATGDVLNGIAYNKLTGKLYMTGKYWTKIFEVKFPN